jgi:dihydrolipoamide dehydrogenase
LLEGINCVEKIAGMHVDPSITEMYQVVRMPLPEIASVGLTENKLKKRRMN